MSSKKLYPELLTRSALNGVLRIYHDQTWEGVPDDALVLSDQITELWTGPVQFTSAIKLLRIRNTGISQFMHRWWTLDAVISAQELPHIDRLLIAQAALRAAAQWIRDPSELNMLRSRNAMEDAETILDEANMRPGHGGGTRMAEDQVIALHRASAAAECPVYNNNNFAAEFIYQNATLCATGWADSASHRDQTHDRLKLLLALEPLLPDPTPVMDLYVVYK